MCCRSSLSNVAFAAVFVFLLSLRNALICKCFSSQAVLDDQVVSYLSDNVSRLSLYVSSVIFLKLFLAGSISRCVLSLSMFRWHCSPLCLCSNPALSVRVIPCKLCKKIFLCRYCAHPQTPYHGHLDCNCSKGV